MTIKFLERSLFTQCWELLPIVWSFISAMCDIFTFISRIYLNVYTIPRGLNFWWLIPGRNIVTSHCPKLESKIRYLKASSASLKPNDINRWWSTQIDQQTTATEILFMELSSWRYRVGDNWSTLDRSCMDSKDSTVLMYISDTANLIIPPALMRVAWREKN